MVIKSVTLIAFLSALKSLVAAPPCNPSTSTDLYTAGITTTTFLSTTINTSTAKTSTNSSEAATYSIATVAPDSICKLERFALEDYYSRSEANALCKDCRQSCIADLDCKAFLIYSGVCFLYHQSVSEFVMAGKSSGFFYNRGYLAKR